MVATQQGLAAVEVTVDNRPQGVAVVDLGAGEVLWERTDFVVMDGHDGVLVGVFSTDEGYSVAGVSLAAGEEMWTQPAGPGPTLQARSPWFGVDEGRGPGGIRMVDITTGDTVLDQGDGLTQDTHCSAAATVMMPS
ncbi:hypothetical protein ACFC1B_07490 [Streptomyces xiamenensis]|uniref:hypothetical protein n=1 Tax=Streptomyces xiamenensis TaxID=408015 RepID=UPI0035D992D0